MNIMHTYVALILDASDRYGYVYGIAEDWPDFADQLEKLGCEVVEDQTDDYDMEDLGTIDDELGVVPITRLVIIY